jgi:hypothetical protein
MKIEKNTVKQFFSIKIRNLASEADGGGWTGIIALFVWIVRGTQDKVAFSGLVAFRTVMDTAVRSCTMTDGEATFTEIQGHENFELGISAV